MKDHVVIRIVNRLFCSPRSDHQKNGVLIRPVFQTMGDGITGFPPRCMTGCQDGLLILHQDKFAGYQIDEFIFGFVPMTMG